ncbi:unnamed protein product [Diabrotica balteata]|uniref:Protein kinase domain-containing protein n=1 Tax=Diabrotica balteata TaxID=107213 RepID=A0A9N9SKW6_DIABA|nr:unnamed protein product [Diabrotica balteata]
MTRVAPETQTQSVCSILSDMYSLGMVICSIFNNGRSLIQANNSTSAYLKQIELLDDQVHNLIPRIPVPIQEAASRLVSKDPRQRPTAQLLTLIKYFRFRTMDKPTASSMADENSCIICIHLGLSSKTYSNLGEVIKICRGVTSLKAASTERQDGLLPHLQTEFVYAHLSCRQKYINKKYIGVYNNKLRENLSLTPPKKKNFEVA